MRAPKAATSRSHTARAASHLTLYTQKPRTPDKRLPSVFARNNVIKHLSRARVRKADWLVKSIMIMGDLKSKSPLAPRNKYSDASSRTS